MRAIVIESEVRDPHRTNERYATKTAHEHLVNPKMRLTDIPYPHVGPFDILIQIQACGLCGSDVAMTTTDARGFVEYPFMMSDSIIPGHEFAGVVANIGKSVKTYWPEIEIGEPVVAQCVLNCGYCSACKRGAFDHCTKGDELGFTKNGAMAEYCIVNMRQVWSIHELTYQFTDEEIFLAGSLIEPHAGVFKAITENRFCSGDNVLVIGLGPIGLAAVNVFQALGAGVIIGYDPSLSRCKIAEEIGNIAWTRQEKLSLSEAVNMGTQNKGVSHIFEASGVAEKNWSEITKILAKGPEEANLIFFGQSKIDLPVNPQPFIQKYLRFSGSHGHTKVWEQVINLFAAGRINPLPIITKKIALADVPYWLADLRTNKNEGKVTITNFEGESNAARV